MVFFLVFVRMCVCVGMFFFSACRPFVNFGFAASLLLPERHTYASTMAASSHRGLRMARSILAWLAIGAGALHALEEVHTCLPWVAVAVDILDLLGVPTHTASVVLRILEACEASSATTASAPTEAHRFPLAWGAVLVGLAQALSTWRRCATSSKNRVLASILDALNVTSEDTPPQCGRLRELVGWASVAMHVLEEGIVCDTHRRHPLPSPRRRKRIGRGMECAVVF